MPTMSNSLVQPLVTPSTELFTSALTSPCTAALESSSRTTTRLPSLVSNFTPAGMWVVTLPLGPCTVTVLPSTAYVTPLGNGIGFFPILDISLSLPGLAGILQLPVASHQQPNKLRKALRRPAFPCAPGGRHHAL